MEYLAFQYSMFFNLYQDKTIRKWHIFKENYDAILWQSDYHIIVLYYNSIL